MMDLLSFSSYQIAVVVTLGIWIMPLLLIWARYDSMPHSPQLLICILLSPLILTEEILKAFALAETFPFLIGVFTFLPVLVTSLVYIAISKILSEIERSKIIHCLLIIILIAGQVPLLMLPDHMKLEVLQNPLVGNLVGNWPIYAYYTAVITTILLYSIKMEDRVKQYQHRLSDHVVDVEQFKMTGIVAIFNGLISVAFGTLTLLGLVAFGVIEFERWQSVIAILHSFMLCLVVMVLLGKRRYAPSPLDYKEMASLKYSEQYLTDVLRKTEKAIAKHKAYKKIGLRLRALADAAEVEPMALAIAMKKILKRNFRNYIYYHRLEYAMKLLMRTDIKVSTVARRLGFNSDKYLSDMFVKHAQSIGRNIRQEMQEG